jgi:carboxypeptidase Taq
MSESMSALRQRLAEIEDLRGATELLGWDQQTMMPPRGAEQRAEALGTLERIAHERFTDDQTGRLLDAAESELAGVDDDSNDVRIIRKARRNWEKARRVPTDLAAEMAHAGSIGQEAWVAARAANDFGAFAPHLQRNLDLVRRYVDCFDDFDPSYECAYDVLLDDYDPGTRTREVSRLFDELRDELVPLIATLSEHAFEDQIRTAAFPVSGQRQLVGEVLRMMGFDPAGWRLDDTVHPFATSLAIGDVRVTTRFDEHWFPMALYGAMHECGHGLYAAGVAPELERTPLASLDSLSTHESQSRLWENLVGRSRPFCDRIAPRIAELAGGPLAALSGEQLFRAVNQVTPSLIRIEADEATYGLHIVLRFELEQQLVEGRLSVSELPEAWNAAMKQYLGVDVPSDADGVMQDVHWSCGLIGYFPTYALGNLISGQLWRQAHLDLPDLDQSLVEGDFQVLLSWLREHVHQVGSKYSRRELLERVVGGPIAVEPFVSYLKAKLGDVYQLSLS